MKSLKFAFEINWPLMVKFWQSDTYPILVGNCDESEPSWRIFSSARLVTFSFQLKKNQLETFFFLIFPVFSKDLVCTLVNLFCDFLCNEYVFLLKMTYLLVQKFVKPTKKAIYKKKNTARFQLENWRAPARLGSESSQLGLARAGKFQLELISTRQVVIRH